ncbi:DinB family protein [Flavimaricola marinus]|nr:DinB family protein [Flavimaricola marinus]
MARNNAWANEVLSSACARLSAEAFDAPRSGFFGSIRATLTHIFEVDLYYLDALEEGGRGRSVFDTTGSTIAAPDLGTLQKLADRRLVRFCDDLSDADLERTVITDRADGPRAERIGDLLLHLFQHQIHHRGQAHAMLSGTEVPPPQLDDFYLAFGRAPAAQAWLDYTSKEPSDVS